MNTTMQLVSTLKENDQDFEWYPTTDVMISAVRRWLPEDTDSIMDIGAGDGRVLAKFAEKCKDAQLYSIELSPILIQKQPQNIIPVGTDLHQQNLSCLRVDYIFSNMPFSQYEEWASKIISEGFAHKAFLIMPQRWVDNVVIKDALKRRGATARVIHSDDFYDAERRARAVVDIVEILYPSDKWGRDPKDPFDIWFDQNIDMFEKPEEFRESETSRELARKYAHASIDEMVEAYTEEYSRMEKNYRMIFQLDQEILRELDVDKKKVREGLKKKMADLKIKYWQILFERLDAITSRLTTKSKKRLLDRLTGNTAVEFTVSNAYSVVLWAIKNANQYFDEQTIQLFKDLSTFEGVMKYVSNQQAWGKDHWRYMTEYEAFGKGYNPAKASHYKLDYRIVVQKYNAIKKADAFGGSWDYPGDLKRECHELIADVVAVMSNLGYACISSSSFNRRWVGGQWEDFYTSTDRELFGGNRLLFQVKGYLNGNLHFRFMPEAIKALNVQAAKLLKWVRTEEDVVTEMGYTREEAKKYFNHNPYILPSNVPLLGGGE